MSSEQITVVNARQHNLKGMNLEIPRGSLTVITGPSGSGKSSLAFDTLYAEGQRRYVESLSTYAKQFLERMPKPAVDRIEGISPAVAIEQKNPTTSSRSTVGTSTEIYDYLRLLWARIGVQECPDCGGAIAADSPTTAAERLIESEPDQEVLITFPIPGEGNPSHELLETNLRSLGFIRIVRNGTVHRLDELPEEVRLDDPQVRVVVDRLRIAETERVRLADSLATAFTEGEGRAEVRMVDGRAVPLTSLARCANCGNRAVQLTPALFSFNSPRGACAECNGFGAVLRYDEDLIVPDPEKSLAEGALDPWTKPRYTSRRRLLRETAVDRSIDYERPWHGLKKGDREFLLHGKHGRFKGVIPFLEALESKRYKQYIRVFLRQYQKAHECPSCRGGRLRREALSVRVAHKSIAEVSSLTADHLLPWLESIDLSEHHRTISETILRELLSRVRFLCDVGLGYLSMDRQTRTLSGGEAQRISLANALGSNLVDTLYVLDEPSIGLHPRDINRLIDLLRRLRNQGNSVVVVEHDPATIRAADHLIELGPGAGEHGGELIFSGPAEEAETADSLTAKYLRGEKRIAVPSYRRSPGPHRLVVEGARIHNLRDLSLEIPLGILVAVTGVSGSGKSTLVHDVIFRNLAHRLKGKHGAKEHLGELVGEVTALEGWESLEDIVMIDQNPIGRTPRSNPVTYLRAFDEIRALFAAQPLAQARGYSSTTFSFNAADGGRCRACDGSGHIQVEMVFLADIFVPCEACGGTRFEREVLDVKINGLSIHDVLNLTVTEAMQKFRHQEKLGRSLWYLQQVGLGYLRLGQPATTLSGGEAQRLKIARVLAQVGRKPSRKLYLLDEPTTGLHLDDVRVLIKVLDRLVDAGNTVVVIEHHLDLIKRADWIVDLGPDGGEDGGRVVAQGTPETVAQADSHTGKYLRRVLTDQLAEVSAEGA